MFYVNASGVVADTGDGMIILNFRNLFSLGESVPSVAMPRRVAEELLKRLAEALMPDEPEASGEGQPAEPELPLAGDGWVDEKPVEVERPWRERFGVES